MKIAAIDSYALILPVKEIYGGKAVLTDAAGLGIEINQPRLAQAAMATD
jgi:hypothetical protein